MPLFHFNVFNFVDASDIEGQDFPDLNSAIAAAVRGARELVAEHILRGEPIYRNNRIEITDDNGTLLHAVQFGDIVDLRD